jgi:NDP-sugar pyrophosphorylase family protein
MTAVTIDIPAILTGLGALVTACAAAYSIVRNGRRIEENHRVVKAIDMAVNGRGSGSTISDDITDLHNELGPERLAAGVVLEGARAKDPDDLRSLMKALIVTVEENTKATQANHMKSADGPPYP